MNKYNDRFREGLFSEEKLDAHTFCCFDTELRFILKHVECNIFTPTAVSYNLIKTQEEPCN